MFGSFSLKIDLHQLVLHIIDVGKMFFSHHVEEVKKARIDKVPHDAVYVAKVFVRQNVVGIRLFGSPIGEQARIDLGEPYN